MSTTVATPEPTTGLFPLPGFQPDAVPFAFRTTLALLLAYFVSFAIQLNSASSAGLCVAIVAQSTPGMALSKAAWRMAGTLIGGVAAVALVAAFPQNRTMILMGFTLWLGGCTFVAALLRDFRSYGAVLAGYTVGIIAIGNIDAPDGVFLSAMNRVAAISIGILSVMVVNTLLAPPGAFDNVLRQLRTRMAAAEDYVRRAVGGETLPDDTTLAETGAAILALRTEAGYAALELPGGAHRKSAATAAIAGLLGMISAARAVGAAAKHPPSPAREVFRAERLAEVERQRVLAHDGITALEEQRAPAERVELALYQDPVGAFTNALRTIIAVALGCVFCILGGWSGATLLLIQQAAFTALFGMQPNPSAAATATGITIPPAALATFFIGFVLLPQASGYVPFALALAPFAFGFALLARHKTLAPYGPGLLLYLTLLLSPANTQDFDLSAFANTCFVQVLAISFMLIAFKLILPVMPERRLMRAADSLGEDLNRALRGRARLGPVSAARSFRYDRLAAAQVWLGRRTPARLALLRRLCRFSELDAALRRAQYGLVRRHEPMPAPSPAAMDALVAKLMAGAPSPSDLIAISGLYESAMLLRTETKALRRYGVFWHTNVA